MTIGNSRAIFKPHPAADPAEKLYWRVWLALVALHLLYSFVLRPEVYISTDEAAYILMSKYLAEQGSLWIANGWHEIKSGIFYYNLVYRVTPEGHLTGHYPPLFPAAGVPLYPLFGLDALHAVNALCYLLLVAVTFKLAARGFGDRVLAHQAALILALATFTWPFSQMALSHVVNGLLVLCACYFFLRGFDPPGQARALLLAGFFAGLAVLARLDGIYVLWAMLIMMGFERPLPWRRILLLCAGVVPPLVLLAWINRAKFGTFMPFYYDNAWNTDGFAYPNVMMAFAVLAVPTLLLWLWSRLPDGFRRNNRPVGLAVFLALLLVAVAVLPDRLWQNVFKIWVGQQHGHTFSNLARRGFLESFPYVACLFLLFLPAAWGQTASRAVRLFLLTGVVYLIMFGVVGNDGDIGLHLRFFYPLAPLAAILTAHVLRHLLPSMTHMQTFSVAAVAVALCYGLAEGLPLPYVKTLHLNAPLWLAAGILLLSVSALLHHRLRRERLASAKALLPALIVFSLAWTSATLFLVEMPVINQHSRKDVWKRAQISKTVEPNALVIVAQCNLIIALYKRLPQGRIGCLNGNRGRHATSAIRHYLQEGRPVYLFLPREEMEKLTLGERMAVSAAEGQFKKRLWRVSFKETPAPEALPPKPQRAGKAASTAKKDTKRETGKK